jgi:hypothetical protein
VPEIDRSARAAVARRRRGNIAAVCRKPPLCAP